MKNIKNSILGKDKEHIPNFLFGVMRTIMRLSDMFFQSSAKNFKSLNLKEGQTVVDYGCGPARYIENASKAIGEKGKLYAVDIHHLAIKSVQEKIRQKKLNNVEALLIKGYSTPIADKSVDVVYALDMFHMVESPSEFLKEFHRILKDDGIAIIEDGHQDRSETIDKIKRANLFEVVEEIKAHIKCKKLK